MPEPAFVLLEPEHFGNRNAQALIREGPVGLELVAPVRLDAAAGRVAPQDQRPFPLLRALPQR